MNMLTKQQKIKQVEEGVAEIKNSKTILFADFTGISTSELRNLRLMLKEVGGKFKVIKKRLLKIALRKSEKDSDPTQFKSQVGAILLSKDIFSAAGNLYKFVIELAKTKKDLKILGGFNLPENKNITSEEFVKIAKLPPREILLTQIAIMLTMPVKKIMIALNEVGKTQKSN